MQRSISFDQVRVIAERRWTARPSRVALFMSLAGVGLGCGNLEATSRGVCGNGIVEASIGEWCDGGENCGAPGEVDACLFTCASSTDCPEGFACGRNGQCAKPSWRFTESDRFGVAADTLEILDLDEDAQDDLVFGASVMFIEDGRRAETVSLGKLEGGEPALGDIDDDGRIDIVTAIDRSPDTTSEDVDYVVWRNEGDREFRSLPFTHDWTQGAIERFMAAPDPGRPAPVIVQDGVATNVASNEEIFGGVKRPLTHPGSTAFSSPECPSRAAVLAGTSSADPLPVEVRTLCGSSGIVRKLMPPSLPGDSRWFPWVTFADVDVDGRLDVLVAEETVQSEVRFHVAYGRDDGSFDANDDTPKAGPGNNTFSAAPVWELKSPPDKPTMRPPFLVQDVDGDEIPDIVVGNDSNGGTNFHAIVASSLAANDCGAVYDCSCGAAHACFYLQTGGPFAVHHSKPAVFDADGNEALDLVAYSSGQFWRYIQSPVTGAFDGVALAMDSDAPIGKVVTGDFDGDLRDDVAILVPEEDIGEELWPSHLDPILCNVYGTCGIWNHIQTCVPSTQTCTVTTDEPPSSEAIFVWWGGRPTERPEKIVDDLPSGSNVAVARRGDGHASPDVLWVWTNEADAGGALEFRVDGVGRPVFTVARLPLGGLALGRFVDPRRVDTAVDLQRDYIDVRVLAPTSVGIAAVARVRAIAAGTQPTGVLPGARRLAFVRDLDDDGIDELVVSVPFGPLQVIDPNESDESQRFALICKTASCDEQIGGTETSPRPWGRWDDVDVDLDGSSEIVLHAYVGQDEFFFAVERADGFWRAARIEPSERGTQLRGLTLIDRETSSFAWTDGEAIGFARLVRRGVGDWALEAIEERGELGLPVGDGAFNDLRSGDFNGDGLVDLLVYRGGVLDEANSEAILMLGEPAPPE